MNWQRVGLILVAPPAFILCAVVYLIHALGWFVEDFRESFTDLWNRYRTLPRPSNLP